MKLTKYILLQSLFIGFIFNFSISANAQRQSSKGLSEYEENLTSFRAEKPVDKNVAVWKKLNLPSFYTHPDFGKLPYNAPCEECVEILDRRVGDYRYFVDANDHQKFYVQKSLGYINYKENNHWVSQDLAVKSVSNGVFETRRSEQKVGIDVQNKRTYIETTAGKINFNQWQLIGLSNGNETLIAEANWNSYTVGENGARISNIFPNVDAEMIVSNGSVKTNFILKKNNLGQYDKLVFRDAMSANQPISFNFQHTSDLIAAGKMSVNVGGQKLLQISEGIAYPKYGSKKSGIVLNYTHSGSKFDVIVPMDWINLNINNGPLVIDPLVTGTATLAQALIIGSMYNAVCSFDLSCDYSLVVPTPAQATFTDVRIDFEYASSGLCFLEDGGFAVDVAGCVSPPGAGNIWSCGADPSKNICQAIDFSIMSHVSSCLPPPSCLSQNVTFTLKFFRTCKGNAGCDDDCIGAYAPFVGVIEGRTLEFVDVAAPITLAPTVCQGQALTASTATTGGVAPFSYNWSFNTSGTPSLGTNFSQSITFPIAGPQTVYLKVTDACGNVVNSSADVTVEATPNATVSGNSPICAGGTLNLIGTANPASSTYAWTGPSAFTSTLKDPIINSVTTANNGLYSLVVTEAGCSSPPVSVAIVVNPLPVATPTSNSPVCLGGTLILEAGIVGATYSWSGAAGFTSPLQSPTITPMTPTKVGVYTLTVTSNGCTSLPVNTTVLIGPSPTATAANDSPVCEGGTVNLTATTVLGATYGWVGPNGFSTNTQNPVLTSVTAANAGVYTLVVLNGAGCPSLPANTTVVVNPSPVATPTNTSPICEGDNFTLQGNTIAGATYAWTGPNSFTSNAQNAIVNAATTASAGVYSLVVTSGGCSSPAATTTAVITPSPVATPTNTSPICEGGNAILQGNNIAGATYAWTGPNSFSSTLQNPTLTTAAIGSAGVYSLVITNGGCASLPATTTVVINATPVSTPTYNTGVCAGGTLNLTGNTIAGATYAWTGPNGFTASVQNPTINTVTPVAGGTYTLTVTNNGCVSTPATLNVVISPAPTATASYNFGVCSGGTLVLSSTTVPSATYSWTGPNGFFSTLQNPTITTVSALAAGTYNLTVNVSGCAPATSSVTVLITPGPTATATSNAPICSGSTLNLNATAVTNGTYGWTGPNGFTSSSQNVTIPSATSAESGAYILTITTVGCAPVTSTVNVVVTANPVANASSNAPICIGETLNLSANTVATATYSWSGPDSFTSTLQNPTIPNTNALNTGTYSLTVSVGTCNSAVSTTSVSFHPSPIVNVTKTDVLCNNGSTGTATATPTVPGAYTYAWSPSGGTGQVANNLSIGVYTVVTTNANGCKSSNSITIGQPTDIVLSMSSTLSACALNTGSATVVATGGSGSYTYVWSPSGGTAATANNLAVGSYSVTVTDGNGCTKVGNVNVISANPPIITVTNVSNVTCFGLTNGAASITVNGGAPGYNYTWLPTGGNGSVATNLAGGQYTVTVTDNIGCKSSQVIDISAPDELIVNTSGDGVNCGFIDGTATATVTGGTGLYTYVWTPGNLNTATIIDLTAGTYNVVVTDGNGCTAANSYDVVQIGGLSIQVNPVTAVIFEGESVNLNATLVPYVPGLVYTWSPASTLSCDDCPNPIATPDSSTVYTIMITTPDGCKDSVTSTIFTKVNCGEYFIPTVFSPNGDGRNDIFKVFGKCIVSVDLDVFNRWGEKVFEGKGQESGWDGNYKGETVSTDSYYYTVKISFQDGTVANEKGSINVVR